MDKEYILVTGGTGNIGGKIVAHLLKKECNVIYTSRSRQHLKELRTLFEGKIEKESDAQGVVLDLCDFESLTNFLKEIKRYKITAFINNAAIDNTDFIKDIKYNSLKRIMDVNCAMPILLMSDLLTNWVEKKVSGKIINISSLLAIFGSPKSALYSASKAAMESFLRNVTTEYAKYGIMSNTIRIANIAGDLINENEKTRIIPYDYYPQENKKNSMQETPSQRLLSVVELINLIDFLLFSEIGYLNGQSINLDGGISIKYPNYSL
ncbi:MAG: SDR family oxidoreductase [Lactobacillales bacterium]|jgi:short-subunit dehydrogenase|nr:SDR family oxidoreductase [Lactobacillales bacterium]